MTVRAGVARLDDGTLAGSVLTMDRAVRNFVELGATVPEAIGAVTDVPARLIGRPELASMEPGTPADVTVLDEALAVQRTIVNGRETWAR